MAKEFLGKGWKFPVQLDLATETISMSEYEQDIQEAIWIILSTAQGERVMHPEFGCRIRNYVFATMSMTTVGLVESSVREALVRWEPRIAVQDVKAAIAPGTVGKLLIDIRYYIHTTNTEFNLVYPFYLQGG